MKTSIFTILCVITTALVLCTNFSYPQTIPLFERSDYTVGQNIIGIEKGDFNQDNYTDIVLLGSGGNITVLPGSGDGAFNEPIHTIVGSGSRFIHVDDFNNDGIDDLIIESALLLNDGSGNFSEEIAQDFSGLYPPVTGDVNGDGYIDVLTVLSHYENGHIYHELAVATGHGDGTFGEIVCNDLPFASSVILKEIGDFNCDTIPDLLITYQLDYDENGPLFKASAPISFFCFGFMPGHGDGSFDDVIENEWYWAGETADFNNDGILDVLGGIYLEPTFSVLSGDGSGIFNPVWESPAVDYGGPRYFILDINGDDILDIGLYEASGGDYIIQAIVFFTGNGDGTFSDFFTYTINDFNFRPSRQTTVVCDLNNDNYDDFVIAPEDSSYVYVFINSGQKTFISDAETTTELSISSCSLLQNSPNPFNNSTVISFHVTENTSIILDVYDISGQKVDTLADRIMGKGTYSIIFDGSGLASGMYFYSLRTPKSVRSGKMLLVK